jgi:hypothetical protein
MSRSTIKTYIEARCAEIEGIARVGPRLDDGNYPPADMPYCVVELGQPKSRQLTMGVTGKIEQVYPAGIAIIVDRKDADYDQALEASIRIADRLRAKFAADWTLGGNCFNADLSEGIDNLPTFREAGQYPQVANKLMVTEQVAANAPAS